MEQYKIRNMRTVQKLKGLRKTLNANTVNEASASIAFMCIYIYTSEEATNYS